MTAAAVVAFVSSALVARIRPIPTADVDVTLRVNAAPDWIAHALWPVMQLGTIWAPVVAAVLVGVYRRDWLLALCVGAAGAAAWFAARIFKALIDRGRPGRYLTDIDLREGTSRGLGFPSGHSAVAAATAIVLVAAVPRRARPLLALGALAVGLARIVHGVHFAADVIGGWALGVGIGVAALAVYDRTPSRAPS